MQHAINIFATIIYQPYESSTTTKKSNRDRDGTIDSKH
jgi:hypothetical protein